MSEEEKDNVLNNESPDIEEDNISEDFEESKQETKEKKLLVSVLDGSYLVKTLFSKEFTFWVLLAIFACINIWNNHDSEKLERQIQRKEKELKELRAMSISIKSDLMQKQNLTELLKLLKTNDVELMESTIPATRIVIPKSKKTKKKQ